MSSAPHTDLLTYALEHESPGSDIPILVDAYDTSRFLTLESAKKTVRALIAGLHADGLGQGDCVCVHAFNDIYYPLLYLAIIGAGAIYTGSNPAYTSLELDHHVKTSRATYIIAEPSFLTTVLETASHCDIPKSRIYVFDAFDRAVYSDLPSWTTLLEHGEEDWVRFDDPETSINTTAQLAFTSGTTGLPKAAMISHAYHVSQIHAIQSFGKPYKVSRLLCLPAFHTFGLPLISGCAFREGHTVYLMRKFEVSHFVDCISRFQITETAVVPAMLISILNAENARPNTLASLRYIWSAGSPLRHSTQANFQVLLNREAKIVQVWGMTELGWGTAFFWPEGDDTGSVGRALPGMNIKLVDNDGSTIGEEDMEGEMLVKGSCMMRGYLDNPTATAETVDSDGWLHTGDVAYQRNGKWYVVDRKKDLLKVRGWQVSPAELESVLLTHPAIAGAAVLGVLSSPDDRIGGEVPRAYIVRKGSNEVTEQDVKTFAAERLAKYKHLEGGVRFVADIPRNASGKIMRQKLRALDTELRNEHHATNPVREIAITNNNDIQGSENVSKSLEVSPTSATSDDDVASQFVHTRTYTRATTPEADLLIGSEHKDEAPKEGDT